MMAARQSFLSLAVTLQCIGLCSSFVLPGALKISTRGISHNAVTASPLSALRSLHRTSSNNRNHIITLMASSTADSLTSSSPSAIAYDKVAARVQTSSWLAWWAQAILSVVSAVTIFFANAVKGPAQTNILINGIFLAGMGLAVSFINVFWTWSYSRSATKVLLAEDPAKQCRKLKASLKLGVIIALSGMFITLMGAEQIVGTLVAKAITGSFLGQTQIVASPLTAGMQLQALDIFVVQANTNTLLAHLASVINSLYISTVVPQE